MLKKAAISGVRWTSASTVINSVFQLLQLFILSRYLSPDDFGVVALCMVIIGFMRTFSDLGISAAVIHKDHIADDVISGLYWLNVFSGILLFFISLGLNFLLPVFFGNGSIQTIFPVISISFLIIPFGILFQVFLQKNLEFNRLAIQEIISTVTGSSVAIVLAVTGFGVWSLVAGQLANVIVRSSLLLFYGLRNYKINFELQFGKLKDFLNFGLFQMGEKSINYFSERLDHLIIGSVLGTHQLGYYNFAFNFISQPVNLINPVFTKVAFPVMAKVKDDLTLLRKSYLKLLRALQLINAPLLFGAAIIAPYIFPVIFGEKWNPAIPVFQTLSFVVLIRSIGNPVGSLILAKGRADLGFYWNIALALVSVPVIYFSSKDGDIVRVAASLLLLQIVLQFPAYNFLIKPFLGKIGWKYIQSFSKPLLLSVIMLLPVYLLLGLISGHNITAVISLIFLGIVIYSLLVRFLSKEDYLDFKGFLGL